MCVFQALIELLSVGRDFTVPFPTRHVKCVFNSLDCECVCAETSIQAGANNRCCFVCRFEMGWKICPPGFALVRLSSAAITPLTTSHIQFTCVQNKQQTFYIKVLFHPLVLFPYSRMMTMPPYTPINQFFSGFIDASVKSNPSMIFSTSKKTCSSCLKF